MSDESAGRAFVITALPEEFAAVREHLVGVQEHVHPAETVYETGMFQDGGSRWEVAIVQASQGNVAAAMEVERGIQAFNPDVVLMVGVAGGLKDVKIGDVVVANKVYGFEVGKESDGGFQSRPGFGEVAYRTPPTCTINCAKQCVATPHSWCRKRGSQSAGRCYCVRRKGHRLYPIPNVPTHTAEPE